MLMTHQGEEAPALSILEATLLYVPTPLSNVLKEAGIPDLGTPKSYRE